MLRTRYRSPRVSAGMRIAVVQFCVTVNTNPTKTKMLTIKTRIFKLPVIMSCLVILLGAGSAKSTLVPIDQIIFESGGGLVNPSGGDLSGTVDVTQTAGTTNSLTFLLTNTTPSTAFSPGAEPGHQLLTDF